mmetsp:Transcript_81786/g.240102  ORF Transcript_81786/g.240102 Transcript_81786/m.240102 type:complete len:276 (+) Transcript_81786:1280-2107(+)
MLWLETHLTCTPPASRHCLNPEVHNCPARKAPAPLLLQLLLSLLAQVNGLEVDVHSVTRNEDEAVAVPLAEGLDGTDHSSSVHKDPLAPLVLRGLHASRAPAAIWKGLRPEVHPGASQVGAASGQLEGLLRTRSKVLRREVHLRELARNADEAGTRGVVIQPDGARQLRTLEELRSALRRLRGAIHKQARTVLSRLWMRQANVSSVPSPVTRGLKAEVHGGPDQRRALLHVRLQLERQVSSLKVQIVRLPLNIDESKALELMEGLDSTHQLSPIE